ncbi:MAG: hypothetical protein KatS3mg105_2770 [Gemmatales bacterium]|nr:MAG: hypothetical protein KatS3mg105_2770 [Gemmatales bacterium]
MTRITMRVGLLAAICVLSATAIAYPCSLCSSNLQSQTIRQDAAQAKLVLFGTLTKADLRTNTTTFKIHTRIKSDPFLKKNQEVIELPRYVPIADPARPPQFLIFCDVYRGKLDPYRGTPVQSSDIVEYVNGALQREKQKPADRLLYFFQYLDHPDPQIANDAFLEFAKAADSDIGLVAPKLSAAKLREWVKDP